MFRQLFALAMLSPGRQRAFRQALFLHALVLLAGAKTIDTLALGSSPLSNNGLVLLGQYLLVAGIVEGAILVGWRLTQLPKSQALEFLLVTPQRPHRVLLGEAVVGLSRLALVTLSSLPILLLLVYNGRLQLLDVPVLLLMPFTWGAITGLGLTLWAYEPLWIRRLGERVVLLGIFFYLVVGVLVAEKITQWAGWLPPQAAGWAMWSVYAFHYWNPFSVMQAWMDRDYARGIPPIVVEERMLALELAGLAVVGLLLVRTASRLHGHFHERHYTPQIDPKAAGRGTVGDHPLSWWAVKRISEYAGRANLWVAMGFGLLYAAYTIAGPHWPSWLGRLVFDMVKVQMGGIPVLTTALVVLAAVPAAWQYGLWDSNAHDRCKRLELLLLTGLEPRDYWDAATAAAWRRGRGYFWVAGILWLAALVSGQANLPQVLAAVAASVLLWTLYFALGFRAFARGMQANGLGSLLTLGVPTVTYVLFVRGWPALGALLPPGSVFSALQGMPASWVIGPLAMGAGALWLSRRTLASCDADLRRWYDLNHGQRMVE